MALARTGPMPFRLASSVSEAVLMSIGSFLATSAFFASALAGSAFLASALAAGLASTLGVSAFWANAMPVAAMAATRKAKILCMLQSSSRGWGQSVLWLCARE